MNQVASASIICDAETGRPRGFAFVDFVEEASGESSMHLRTEREGESERVRDTKAIQQSQLCKDFVENP